MALSIFNSDKRLLLALLSAFLVTLFLALLNLAIHINMSKGKDGIDAKNKLWRNKVFPTKKYEIVFLGDSRVLTGISPEIFERKLNCTAINGSFAGGSINETIFKHTAENLLSKSVNHPRAVVIGVTPMVMSVSGRSNQQFMLMKKEYTENPLSVNNIIQILFQELRSKYIRALFKKSVPDKIYHANGFIERFAKLREKARQSSLHTYRIYFQNYEFSQAALQELLQRIELWKKENVTVFAFRPPVDIDMDTLENNSGKCDFAFIRKKIEEKGGVWLEPDNRETYHSYDSSHLASHEARRLSEDLAEKMAIYFKRKNTSK